MNSKLFKESHESLLMNHEVHKMMATLSQGYQITIPADWRHKMGITKGSKVDVKFNEKTKKMTVEPIKGSGWDEIFRQADNYKHNLSPEQLKKMKNEVYGKIH